MFLSCVLLLVICNQYSVRLSLLQLLSCNSDVRQARGEQSPCEELFALSATEAWNEQIKQL